MPNPATHTPGPWEVIETDHICYVKAAGIWHPNEFLATVHQGFDFMLPVAANADLIASAPDLLAACRLMLEARDSDDGGPMNPVIQIMVDESIKSMRAAIAKAEGRV